MMDNTTMIISFLGGLGVGSILTALVQHNLSRKLRRIDLLFKERNEVFQGLLQSIENLEIIDSAENGKRFEYWTIRAGIIASQNVYERIEYLKTTKPYGPDRRTAIESMVQAMRKDLDIL